MYRFPIFSHQRRQNPQLTLRPDLHVDAKNLATIQRQNRPVFFIPFIRYVSAEKLICPGLDVPHIFIDGPKSRRDLHCISP